MSSQPITTIQGVRFFDNPPACISHFESTPWLEKVISLIQSFGSFLSYTLNKISLAMQGIDHQIDPLTKPDIELSKRRLVVCVHGLNNNPMQFKKIITEMQKRDLSETDIFVPYVLEKGNAKLQEMVKPIFEKIAKWAETPGEKELVLVGVSNGGRISKAIAAEIAQSKCNANIGNLKFVSIVGACKGSSLADVAQKLGLSWVMSKNIAAEMPTDSLCNRELDEQWRSGLSNNPGRREYTFIASPHDWQVTNYDSSLMEVDAQNTQYAIVPGHGHNSIVNAVDAVVAEIALR